MENKKSFEFNACQMGQIDEIEYAAQNFLDVLLNKPDYLCDIGECTSPHDVNPLEFADTIAELFMKKGYTVFFPVRIENATGCASRNDACVSDIYR